MVKPWMPWTAGLIIGLYLSITNMGTDPGFAYFEMFFAGMCAGCLYATYTKWGGSGTNSTQSGWANKKRRDGSHDD